MQRWHDSRRHSSRFKSKWYILYVSMPRPSPHAISGSFHYARTFGVRSLDSQEPLEINDIMCIASCTKLMTSIAAMQCVERGLVALETDVAEILPELATQGILTGFDQASGEPIIQKRQKTMTLR